MARYEITAPDGRKFEISAPEGATQEQVLAYAQSSFAQMQQERQKRIDAQIAADRELYSPTAGMSGMEKFLAGAGKSFVETGQGIAQLFGAGPSEQQVSERRRLDEPLMQTGAGLAGNIAGGVAQGLALPGSQLIAGAKLLPALATGAAQGAALSGLQAVGEGESRLENLGMGAAFGAAGVGATRALGRVLDPLGVRRAAQLEAQQLSDDAARAAARGMSPDDIVAATPLNQAAPRREAAAELLQRYGIEPTLAQRTGARPLQTLESVLAEMPATSSQVTAKRAAQQTQFNRQIAKFLGEQGDEISEDTLDAVFKRGNDLYDKIGKSVTVKIDDDALNAAENVWQEASLSLGTENKALFQGAIDRILKASDDGLSGSEYVKLRQQLGQAAMSADRPFASAMRGLREVLDDAMERSAGQKTADALRKARQEMRLALILRDSGAVSEGAASIRKTAGAIERANRKGKMPSDVKEFARAAAEILPDKVPNSGTAQRLAMQNALTGAATPGLLGLGTGLLTGDPFAGAGAAAAYYGGPRAMLALMQSGAGGRYLAGELAPRVPEWLARYGSQGAALLPLAAMQANQ